MLQADKKRSQEAPSYVWSQCPEVLWSSDFTNNITEFKRKVKRYLPKENQINKANKTVETRPEGIVKQPSRVSAEGIKAIQGTGRKSVNQFASAEIAKTEVFARRYWHEMGVKSPFFRAWFGDWGKHDASKVQMIKQA